MVELGLILIALGLTTFFMFPDAQDIWREKLAWFLSGPPSIQLEELATLLPPDEEIMVFSKSPITILDTSVELRGGNVSVIYHRFDLRHARVEIVEISAPPKAGMMLTVKDEKVVVLKRVGRRIIKNPRITPEQQRAVALFLRRVRGLATEV